MTDIYKVSREVNRVIVEQRIADGFINGTAMCAANSKEIKFWFQNKETFSLFVELAKVECIKTNVGILPDSDTARLSITRYGEIFPGLITVKRGSPENGGGVWLHPDLAIQLAQWCSPRFALQVSRWVREWLTTGQNPIASANNPEMLSLMSEMSEVIEAHIQSSQGLNRAIHTAIHQQTDTLRLAFQKTKALHQKTLSLPFAEQPQPQPEPLSNLVQLTPRLTSREKREAVNLFLNLIEELPPSDERRNWSSRQIGKYLGVSYRMVLYIIEERNGKRQPPKHLS